MVLDSEVLHEFLESLITKVISIICDDNLENYEVDHYALLKELDTIFCSNDVE